MIEYIFKFGMYVILLSSLIIGDTFS